MQVKQIELMRVTPTLIEDSEVEVELMTSLVQAVLVACFHLVVN
jgi:hypothetical protein